MNFKPSDFYIGLLDFFSVLLPGSILCFIYQGTISNVLNFNLTSTGTVLTAFLVASYVAGHFLYSLGSLLDQYLYPLVLNSEFMRRRDSAYGPAEQIKKEFVPVTQNATPVNVYKWAKNIIEIKQPAMMPAIHRFEADQKFFRSFVVIALFSIGYLLFHYREVPDLGFKIFFWLVLFGLSVYRYINRRFSGTKQAFETIIVLRAHKII